MVRESTKIQRRVRTEHHQKTYDSDKKMGKRKSWIVSLSIIQAIFQCYIAYYINDWVIEEKINEITFTGLILVFFI